MTASPVIRLANEEDADGVRRIYAPYVSGTPVSFEIEPPSTEEMRRRIATTMEQFPWLVCENRGEVVGYVYAGQHRARAAYAWSVDVTVYIDQRCHRSGVGRALYTSLFQLLVLQGYYNAFAGVTLPNAGSVGLHEAVGFQAVGIYRAVGFKSGKWHDVVWLQLSLQERPAEPAAPVPIAAIQSHPGWQAALDAGLPWLKL